MSTWRETDETFRQRVLRATTGEDHAEALTAGSQRLDVIAEARGLRRSDFSLAAMVATMREVTVTPGPVHPNEVMLRPVGEPAIRASRPFRMD